MALMRKKGHKKMKRIFAVFLCGCLFLTACTQTPAQTTPPTTETTEATTEATTQATTEATTVATTQETTVSYPHPLNGQSLAEPWVGRATAVVLNNIRQSLPQHGINNADIVYELETEGGITRLLAIFSQLEGIGNIGPIRSARSFFNSIALSYDAPIIHCGGSFEGRNGHYSDNGDRIDNWAHLDQTYNTQYFFRDQGRLNAGYGNEHTLFTDDQRLRQALSEFQLDTPNSLETDYGLSFSDQAAITGETANTVTITFSGGKTTTMEYNSDAGRYDFYQYDFKQTDGNTKETVDFTNVLMLNTQHWFRADGSYARSFYKLVGSGTGYYAVGGQIVPIQWSRETLRGPLTFTLEDGTPLQLAAGNTYIAFSGLKNYISYK